jgi:hypothetical protein
MIPQMTIQEEADLIIRDVFGDNYCIMIDVILELCEDNGIAYDPHLNGDKINKLIIDNADDLRRRYKAYLYSGY